jgi:hypothetical protein
MTITAHNGPTFRGDPQLINSMALRTRQNQLMEEARAKGLSQTAAESLEPKRTSDAHYMMSIQALEDWLKAD